uniref:Uncharacterized protein n=1 Tax=Physcomitrium patens TaxID=3218 RepID=A0A2K1IVN4_PHYPA|nr:hypothetical protein PHYPA_025271 [Physcomitrium patens]
MGPGTCSTWSMPEDDGDDGKCKLCSRQIGLSPKFHFGKSITVSQSQFYGFNSLLKLCKRVASQHMCVVGGDGVGGPLTGTGIHVNCVDFSSELCMWP